MGRPSVVPRPLEGGMRAGRSETATTAPFPSTPYSERPRSMRENQRITASPEMSSGSLLFHHAHGLCTHSNFVAFADPPADVVAYLFPWVEAELVALEARMAQSRLNRDIALQQFLTLLQWFRIVLVCYVTVGTSARLEQNYH